MKQTNVTPMIMRNRCTGAVWRVSYDVDLHEYNFVPLGNTANIKQPFSSPSLLDKLELAGTVSKCAFVNKGKGAQPGITRQNPARPRIYN